MTRAKTTRPKPLLIKMTNPQAPAASAVGAEAVVAANKRQLSRKTMNPGSTARTPRMTAMTPPRPRQTVTTTQRMAPLASAAAGAVAEVVGGAGLQTPAPRQPMERQQMAVPIWTASLRVLRKCWTIFRRAKPR